MSNDLISFQVTALVLDSPTLIWRDLSPAALILCVLEVKGSFKNISEALSQSGRR